MNASRLLEAAEVAEILSVPTAWVYAQAREWERSSGARGLPCLKLGRYTRFRREAIEAWIERKEGAAA